MNRQYSIAFLTLDRPKCLERGLQAVNETGIEFMSKIVIDDGSLRENFNMNREICRANNFDIIRKNIRRGITNSWNLAIMYSRAQFVILVVDDIVVGKDKRWFDIIELGFNDRHLVVEVPTYEEEENTVLRALNKVVILTIGWYDERFLFAGCDDNDFEIRLRLALGTDNIFPEQTKENTIRHIPDAYQPSFWKYEKHRHLNKDYFLKKWKMVRDVVINGNELRKNMTDYELIEFIRYPNQVKRQIDELDFYPAITDRYRQGDYSAVKYRVKSVSEIYENN